MKRALYWNKHHCVKGLGILLIMAILIAGMPGCRLQLTDPIEVRTWYDLHAIRDDMNAHHILMNDLDSTTDGYTELAGPTADGGQGWLPLRQAGSEYFGWYAGVFDGQGYEIRDLFINRPDMDKVGLFGQIYRLGEIRNVRLVNASVTGSEVVGGLVGMMWRDDPAYGLTNCYFSGNVRGTIYVGGLLGDNALGTVSDSYATGTVTGNDLVGGLVGLNRENGIVDDSYATGSVTGEDDVGGLVGHNWGTVSNSYATGTVTGNDLVGGLVGLNRENGIVDDSYATGSVTGYGSVGGLVGDNWRGTVTNSHATGSVAGSYAVGGLVGGNDGGTMTTCHATGAVTGTSLHTGGLVGENNYGTVSNCYATGAVTGNDYVGGLVGDNWWGTVTNSHATGSVAGEDDVGGLVGHNWGTVSNSYTEGSVTGEQWVGGLVGSLYRGTVSNSHYNYSEVLINGENVITIGSLFHEDFEQWLTNGRFLDVTERLYQEGDYYVINDVSDLKQLLAFGQDESLRFRLKDDIDLGADPGFYIPYLAGELDGNGHKVSNLSLNSDFISGVGLFGHLTGIVSDLGVENVSVTGRTSVGGLVGRSSGTVTNSYSTGSVTGAEQVGGLVGANREDGIVSNSYSAANVTGAEQVGGLVGEVYRSTVTNSYSTGNVTGNSRVGGLVGYNTAGTISDSYSHSPVTGNDRVGGLVGRSATLIDGDNPPEYATVTNSFWDTETSGQDTSAGGTGKTTAEMQDITTFTTYGWDIVLIGDHFNETWYIDNGNDYPRLGWQYP